MEADVEGITWRELTCVLLMSPLDMERSVDELSSCRDRAEKSHVSYQHGEKLVLYTCKV